jgi:hypothetical protein
MTTIFPVAYFGNIAYFRELIQAEHGILEVKEHFVKQTLRTRCEIATANGLLQLNIPVVRKNGSKTVLEAIEIAYETDWRKSHWKAIESAYASAPFFEYYGSEVHELIYANEKNLVLFNLKITQRILSWLDISLELKTSEEYLHSTEILDFRGSDFLGSAGMATYTQVFNTAEAFNPNLSILDIIFCEGPMARNWVVQS